VYNSLKKPSNEDVGFLNSGAKAIRLSLLNPISGLDRQIYPKCCELIKQRE
jgi:hypothetical protein